VPQLQFDDVTFDLEMRQVWWAGREVRLTPKAFELLALLIERRPRVVSKQDIRNRLWPGTFVADSNLPAIVSELREAIGDAERSPRLLRTVHGVGYAFQAAPLSATPPPAASPAGPAAWLVGERGELELASGENVLGREGPGVIVVRTNTASRRHVRISIADGHAVAEDLDSKNGTFVNDRRVTVPTPLADGDQVRIGSMLFTFRLAQPSLSTETQSPLSDRPATD
jgi:DNA-binding winged helix-turn-helix (wHTH) protein